ncbi:MAG: TetR/AcrR family transcriptional regulator, partial [Microbacteriaceae bacterium]|nr:TetR/AcrR family transcriptional regulator [Microbacteriaceae bacterium]
LSPEKICRAALELVDERGDFTLPRLARRLGVSPSSIYHHVQGRPEIINGMRSLISADVLAQDGFPPSEGAWREQVVRWARIYRATLGQHAKAIPIFVGEAVTDAATLEIYERLATLLAAQGFDPHAVIVAVSVIDSYMLGSAMDAASPAIAWVVQPQAHPAFHEALHGGGLAGNRADVAFEAGIATLVANLEAIAGQQAPVTASDRPQQT